ncbi:hypothetical protein EVA_05468 [gut metagenome]|uniref:Uncharacterized protein n=1 Tax=gut metagenome TaxID=749906 RepID=J9GZN4_9ZZZZ
MLLFFGVTFTSFITVMSDKPPPAFFSPSFSSHRSFPVGEAEQ